MTENPARKLSVLYNSIIVAGAAGFLLAIVGISVLQYLTHREHELQLIREKVAERAMSLESVLGATGDHVYNMKRWLERQLADPERHTESSPLSQRLCRNAEGDIFSLDGLNPGERREYGNLFGLASVPQDEPKTAREIGIALGLSEIQNPVHESTPYLTWSYYKSRRDFMAIYPWVSSAAFLETGIEGSVADFLLSRRELRHWETCLAKNHAGRDSWWLPAYVDPAGQGLMVTLMAAVKDKDRCWGTVAGDITLSFLRSFVTGLHYPNGKLVIVNDHGEVLAHTDYDPSGAKFVSRLNAFLPDGVSASKLGTRTGAVEQRMAAGGYHVFTKGLDAAPWALIHVVPESDMARHFLPHCRIYAAVVVGLIVLLVMAHVLIRREFVKPAIALVDHIRTEAIEGPTPVPNVPPAWRPWFRMVSDTLPLKTVAANLPGAVYQFVLHGDGRMEVPLISEGVRDLLGLSPQEFAALDAEKMALLAEDERPKFIAAIRESARQQTPFEYECHLRTGEGRVKWVRFLSRPRRGEEGEIIWDGVMLDVTDRRQAEEEKERSIAELRDALAQVKTLRGLLPICSSCKKIRDDQGYWQQIEGYISRHSDALFTHGICPDCAKKLYPQYFDSDDDEAEGT